MNVIEKLKEQRITKCLQCGCVHFFCEDFNAKISVVSYLEIEEEYSITEPQPLPRVRISCNSCDVVIYEGT